MTLPGGLGPFKLAPGQVTDDSELAMCQIQAIAEMTPGFYEPHRFAKYFSLWFHSNPFDIGMTTTTAFNIFRVRSFEDPAITQSCYRVVE